MNLYRLKNLLFYFLLIIFIIFVLPLESQDLITGTTTKGTKIEKIPVDRFKMNQIVGNRKVDLKFFSMDGINEKISLNVAGINAEVNLEDGSGSLEADMRIAKVGVVSEGNVRHYVFIESDIGIFNIRLELDYTPGMGAITSAMVKKNLKPTPYKLELKNKSTGKSYFVSDKVKDRDMIFHIDPDNWGKKLGAILTCEKKIVLLIDSSGSMKENDPNGFRKEAAKMILKITGDRRDIAVIDFDDKWSIVADFDDSLDEKLSELDYIDSNGGTRIGSAIWLTYDHLKTKNIKDKNLVVVLFTDGIEGGKYEDEAISFAQRGWPIYTVGLSNQVKDSFLIKIANDTSGKYYKLNHESEIMKFYTTLYSYIGEKLMALYDSFKIHPGELVKKSLFVDSTITDLILNLIWPGSEVGLKLIDPSGYVFRPTIKGNSYKIVQIKNPRPGKWSIEMTGVDVNPRGENVQLTVEVDSNLKLSLNNLKNNYLPFANVRFAVNIPPDYKIKSGELKTLSSSGKEKKIKGEIKNGDVFFNFFEEGSTGNRELLAKVSLQDENGNLFERYFKRMIHIETSNNFEDRRMIKAGELFHNANLYFDKSAYSEAKELFQKIADEYPGTMFAQLSLEKLEEIKKAQFSKTLIYVLIFLVPVVGFFLFFLLIRKKINKGKPPIKEQPPPLIPVPKAPDKEQKIVPMINFVSGELAGSTLPLEINKQVIIGRDPLKANIVLSHSQISKSHVLIKYNSEPGNFFIQDLESAHGVYVNGKKIVIGEDVTLPDQNIRVDLGNNVTSFILKVSTQEDESHRKSNLLSQPYLYFMNGELAGTSLPLEKNKTIILGRDPANANIILSHKQISRTHLLINFDQQADNFTIQDLNSRHGVYLNGKRILPGRPIILKEENSRIDLGKNGVSVLFQIK